MASVAFTRPVVSERERSYLLQALEQDHLHGDGPFTRRCHEHLRAILGHEVLLTNSCTAALEMAALLCDLRSGDEVIMPSYTFSSTANAVVLRGATPVFIDIRPDTLNIDESLIEGAVTSRTKAVFVVHYAGVCAAMDEINAIGARHGLRIVEDAAQALHSRYKGRPAGQLGDLGCFSFHATKNIVSGEGGALCTTSPELIERAHVIWEKGTNRREYVKGRVDKYTWVDVGSSFLPSEIIAALLLGQLERGPEITADRVGTWEYYHSALAELELDGLVTRPRIPADCAHNGHLYYLLLPSQLERDMLVRSLAEVGIVAPFHYIPLHSAPAGLRYGRAHGDLSVTVNTSERLIRLPLYEGIDERRESVVQHIRAHLRSGARRHSSTARTSLEGR